MLALGLYGAFLILGGITRCLADGAMPPPPPLPEPVAVRRLTLPPLAPSNATGACTAELNPRRTGCLTNGVFDTFQSGDFLPDGKHVLAQVIYQGAPAAPDPASIFDGQQVIIIKTDGTNFPNGDAWKCVTCGVPEANAVGINHKYDYPQAFKDGSRLLIGLHVLDCHGRQLVSEECTPDQTFIYPLRWNTAADGSGAGGDMREQRLHPDQVHIEFNAFSFGGGKISQEGYFGRLAFDPTPAAGEPLAPRYDVINVTLLYDPHFNGSLTMEGDQLVRHPPSVTGGEFRGFSGDGSEVTYLGSTAESGNSDIFAAHLVTGEVRRVTQHPEYCDPIAFSPDNKWIAIMDTRGSGRNMFIAGMRKIPPLVDMVAGAFYASTRNNGVRRFFEPYLLDWYGDRAAYFGPETYFGQKINGDNDGVPGSSDINDPEWNGMADPRWSPDSTELVFWQSHTVSPACGGPNPLPCYESKEPYGRDYRILVAKFTSRQPTHPPPTPEHPDTIPWAIPYVAGETQVPVKEPLPSGVYTLKGESSGSALVNITWLPAPQVGTVSVEYRNFSDDGLTFLSGTESVTSAQPSLWVIEVDWYSDITQSGAVKGTKKTSSSGYHASIDLQVNVINSTGELITTLDGVEWRSPLSGT